MGRLLLAIVTALTGWLDYSSSYAANAAIYAANAAIALPGGYGGIGLDDLGFSPALGRVLVPAGRTRTLDLINPSSGRLYTMPPFADITSVDYDNGFLIVSSPSAKRLYLIDPQHLSVDTSAPLAAEPDYVRFVAETGEIWVTEPMRQRIEILSLKRNVPIVSPPKTNMIGVIVAELVHKDFVGVPGGPESLIIDHTHARAFTHLWRGTTIAIGLKDHSIRERWPNSCRASRGIALDEERSFLFAGCAEGKLAVLDSKKGRILGRAYSGAGVDIIAYNPKLMHVYLPGAESATMAIIGVTAQGSAAVLRTVRTAPGAHCVTADDHARAFVCDPAKGRILLYSDTAGAAASRPAEH